MKDTALCVRLVIKLLMLIMFACVEQSCSQKSALRIVPTRLHLFEYESVSFTCEGIDVSVEWKVRSNKKTLSKCSTDVVTSTVDCTIEYAYKSDSGEYWCEAAGGERSNPVDITIMDGSVILESPVLPVTEGRSVTLTCKKKEKTSFNLTADFYKDGVYVASHSTGNLTIHHVSKSDEGLYKCRISGAGDSLENWLAVRGLHRENCPAFDHPVYLLLLLRTIFTIVLVPVLLLLVGLLHSGKLRVTQCRPHTSATPD